MAAGEMCRTRWAVEDQLSEGPAGGEEAFVAVRRTRSCRRGSAGLGLQWVLCRTSAGGEAAADECSCGERGPYE